MQSWYRVTGSYALYPRYHVLGVIVSQRRNHSLLLAFLPAEPVPSIKVGNRSIILSNEDKELMVTLDLHLAFKFFRA